MSQTLAALSPLVVAALVLVGVPLMLVSSHAADERSRTPSSSSSTIAGPARPQQVSGRTGVEPPPAPAAPPVPPAPAGVDAPHSTPAGLDSPLPTNPGGHGDGDPQASRVRRAGSLVGDGHPVTSPTSSPGDSRG